MNLLGKWLIRTAVKINLELYLYGIKGLKSKVPSPHRMGQKWHGTRQILKRSPFTVSPNPSYMLLSVIFLKDHFHGEVLLSHFPWSRMTYVDKYNTHLFFLQLFSFTIQSNRPMALRGTSSAISKLHGSFPPQGCPSPFSPRMQAAHPFRPNLISHPLQIHSWLLH